MMTTARKSLLLSLMLHTLMGSLAFVVLVQMGTPPPMMKIDTKHIMVLSLADAAPKQKDQEVHDKPAQVPPQTSLKPLVQQPITPQPIIPARAQLPQQTPIKAPALNTSPTPAVSTPPAVQHSVQNAPAADVVQTPPKPKIDLASEKRSFFAQLRSSIQNALRYPPAARRRGMEGEVGVRFTLSDNGSISSINILSGDAIFHNAAKAAVASASGISVPKNLADSLPIDIDLTLEFTLKAGA